MLAQGRVARYLTYAVGEILLVVLGILIALQINMWNEGRKDQIKEQVVLQHLLEEFNANLQQLDEKIQIREEIVQASIQVLDYIDLPEGVNADSLMAKISITTITPTFDPIINDLVSSGNLRLIHNQKLNRLLTEWPTYVVQLAELEQEYVHIYRNIMLPTLVKVGISRAVDNAFYRNDKNFSFLLDKNARGEKPAYSETARFLPLNDVLSNKELEGILSNAIVINHLANLESRSLRLRIVEILNLLKQETNSEE